MGNSTSLGLGGSEPHDRRDMEGDGLTDGGRPPELAEEKPTESPPNPNPPHNNRVYPNKIPLKSLEKRERGRTYPYGSRSSPF